MTATLEPSVGAGAKAVAGTSPADVIRPRQGSRSTDRGRAVHGSARHLAAFLDSVKELEEDTFTTAWDLTARRSAFQAINESDMLLLPDPASAFVDPCLQVPTLSLTCDVVDPITREPYSRDPRYVARKAEAFLKKSGVATTAYSDLRRSSTSSTPCASTKTRTRATTTSIRKKASGTPARTERPIWVTGRATRKATSRCHRPTGCRIFAPRSCWR